MTMLGLLIYYVNINELVHRDINLPTYNITQIVDELNKLNIQV